MLFIQEDGSFVKWKEGNGCERKAADSGYWTFYLPLHIRCTQTKASLKDFLKDNKNMLLIKMNGTRQGSLIPTQAFPIHQFPSIKGKHCAWTMGSDLMVLLLILADWMNWYL